MTRDPLCFAAQLRLGPGLNVLSGSTGAGKSLVVEALRWLRGERIDHAVLRAGAARASEADEAVQWDYEIALDEALAHMRLGLCIRGPRPLRLRAGEEALAFVEHAQVRGGPPLVRDGASLLVETLGEHRCIDIDIDVDAAVDSGGRDCMRRGETLMLSPDRWLWHPAAVPEHDALRPVRDGAVDARARVAHRAAAPR